MNNEILKELNEFKKLKKDFIEKNSRSNLHNDDQVNTIKDIIDKCNTKEEV